MPSDGNSMLYTDDEPGYRTTKLDSGIPPPSLSTLPRIVKAPRGGGSGAVSIQGQPNRNARQLPPHSHQQPRRMNEFHEPVAPAAPPPAVDVVGRFFVVIDNIHGPNLIEQLSTPDWSRMMGERDDVRGRRTDHRLLGGDIRLVKDLERQKETLIKAALSTRELNQVCAPNNPYEALAQCSALDNLSAIALGHLDFLLHPVREYLKPGAWIRFVDLGSRQGGFSRYILWRSNQRRNGGGAKGWYFGCGDSAAVKQSPAITGSGRGLDIEELSLSLGCSSIADSLTEFGLGLQTKPDILDPATVEAFIEFVKGNSTNTVGVDLVVGECGAGLDLPDFGTDLERRQYAFILAQAVIALRVLRKGGTFVFKMADTTTPLSAEILFLLYSCFDRMAIARSLTSRPTSAERYILCNHLRGEPRWIASHLLAALTRINTDQFKLSHLVSWTRVSAEKKFIDKIASANVTLARTQMLGLKYAIEQHSSSSNNADYQPSKFQIDVAERCLKNWDLQTK